MATKWGCAGAGKISHDFFTAVQDNLPAEDHEFIAIAARNRDNAQEFAKKHGFKTAYGSYEDMAKDPNLEVVYIGTIHSNHVELIQLYLNAGKAVICEKAMTLNLRQANQVFQLAKEKQLFFLEGVWSRFLPAYDRIRQELADGTLGEVKLVQASFCIPIKAVERIARRDLGGGGLLDVGIYVIQLACLVYDKMPENIVAMGNMTETGVDENASILLKYKGGAMACLTYHTDAGSGDNTAVIMGRKGRIELPSPFHCTTTITTPSGKFEFPLKDGDYNFINSANLQYEAAEVRHCLLKGQKESTKYPHRHSAMVFTIMDEVRRQLGFTFPEDSLE